MDRYSFNQQLQGVVRHVLQAADREAHARAKHRLVEHLAQKPDTDPDMTERALDETHKELEARTTITDAAIMEFTDRLFDAIYEPRAESIHEAARLGVSA